jgi:hypothetical protein
MAMGHFDAAVSQYQAGIALALGRVPPEIIQEYYLALARLRLSVEIPSSRDRLASAKYLALAGQTQEAQSMLTALTADEHLGAQDLCDASAGLAWLAARVEASNDIPPWPTARDSDTCLTQSVASNSPDWTLSQGSEPVDAATGDRLVGFSLDDDILEAGVEVLGTLFWKQPDGRMRYQRFRGPNFLPNSGNSWLPIELQEQCIPGYVEPPWVKPCAGRVVASSTGGRSGYLGTLYNAPGDGPDSYLVTATVPVSQNQWMIVGGRWRDDGRFPRGHLARVSDNGDYEAILDISGLPANNWISLAGSVSPAQGKEEAVFWIRPRAGYGDGTLWFDDLFSFSLPQ